jgi:hypothetical protein
MSFSTSSNATTLDLAVVLANQELFRTEVVALKKRVDDLEKGGSIPAANLFVEAPAFPAGFCYLLIFRETVRDAARLALGNDVSFSRLRQFVNSNAGCLDDTRHDFKIMCTAMEGLNPLFHVTYGGNLSAAHVSMAGHNKARLGSSTYRLDPLYIKGRIAHHSRAFAGFKTSSPRKPRQRVKSAIRKLRVQVRIQNPQVRPPTPVAVKAPRVKKEVKPPSVWAKLPCSPALFLKALKGFLSLVKLKELDEVSIKLGQSFLSKHPIYSKQGDCFWRVVTTLKNNRPVWARYTTRLDLSNHVEHTWFPGATRISFVHFLSLSLSTLFFSDEPEMQASLNLAAPPIAALGGVRQVATSLIVPRKAEGFDRLWTPNLWPTQMVAYRTSWDDTTNPGRISSTRLSEYSYHFPMDLPNPRLPQIFEEYLHSTWFRNLPLEEGDFTQVSYDRNFPADETDRVVLDEFKAIGQIISGNMSMDVLKDADTQASMSRALGSRGQRLQLGWEANLVPRWQATRNLAISSFADRNYTEMCFRLVTSRICSTATNDLFHGIQGYERYVANTATNIQIIHINAQTPIPAAPVPGAPPALPVQNNEHDFWLPATQSALLYGTAQFIDGEGLSKEHIALIVGSLAPKDRTNVPVVRKPQPAGVPLPPSPGNSRPQTPRQHQLPPQAYDYYLPNIVRHTYPNGVTHIYVHHGNHPLPNAADQAWIQAHAFDFPDQTVCDSVIRFLSLRHGLGPVFAKSFDIAVYRAVGYDYTDARGADPANRSDDIVDCSGSTMMYLPRNKTGAGYFDVFFTPSHISSYVEDILSIPSNHLVHSLSLISHARAVSLSWACKAGSFVGNIWTLPAAGGQQFLRNHADKWLHQYYDETNLWTVLFANAQATQFGFNPSYYTRRTESGFVIPWWHTYVAPYLANHYLELWMMQTIPTFQVLPYFDDSQLSSHVRWADGTPDQVTSRYDQDTRPQIRLAREIEAFPGHAWLGDGGAEYNSQFYIAQGNNGQFAYSGGRHKLGLRRWDASYARSFPAAPGLAAVHTMCQPGSHFSDFLLPGSLLSYRMNNDRVVNWGVTPTSDLTRLEVGRWWSAGSGEAHTSLMVNYIPPSGEHYEIDSMADYSVTLWTENNRFSAMTFNNVASVITSENFHPRDLKVGQNPFSLNFDSAPHSYQQYAPARITTRVKSLRITNTLNPKAEAKSINSFLGDRVKAQASIKYETKYPLWQDQLPEMRPGFATTNDEGITYHEGNPPEGPSREPTPTYSEYMDQKPNDSPSKEEIERAIGVLARDEEIRKRFDDNYQQYLSEERVKAAARAVKEAEKAFRPSNPSKVRFPKTKKPYTPSVPTPHTQYARNQFTPANTTTTGPQRGQFSGAASTLPKNTVPNDSSAAQAQSGAITMAALLAQKGRLTPTSIVAGQRHPGRGPTLVELTRAKLRPVTPKVLENIHPVGKVTGNSADFPPLPNQDISPEVDAPADTHQPPTISEETEEPRIANQRGVIHPKPITPLTIRWTGTGGEAQDQVLRNLYEQTRPPPINTTTAKN